MTRARHAMTLIELVVGLGILAVLGTLMMNIQRTGWRRVQSTENKITASRTTHEQAEALRRTLATAKWAWVVPGNDQLLYVGRSTKQSERVIEHYHADEDRRLIVDGRPGRGALAEARFSSPRPHLIAFTLVADESSPATGFNRERETSTLKSAVHLATEHEDRRFASFAFEDDHPWCTRGRALHYGFVDP